ncbi:N-acyl homoserine lactonase family protein [Herbaspirillum sp. ST 5-3]|uniref:N-acyl homoserine lactonase family protein n=1 Tax=Oxalobacteraceae TaxID=75682 RepID=UPI0010A353B5|nr:N-acyl homoserine lactonase family protein [Herbaspirillum sp. ST 5-3]
MENTTLPTYEVFALRYATVARRRPENFMVPDPHDGPMPMDYFVWLIRGAGRTWLVDTGFNRAAADERKRNFLRCPIASLAALGLQPEDVSDVIITHLHYDHAGNVNLLPKARIHLQEKELHYATGRYMTQPLLRHPYAVDDVVEIVRGVYKDRVVFYAGDAELAPGIQLLLVGGHTAGLQAVRVHTARGWVVLASDASHFYENIHRDSPFPIVFHVGDMLDAYRRLLSLSDTPDHLIPGHDPLVLQRYPAFGDPASEIACLHEPALRPLVLGGE